MPFTSANPLFLLTLISSVTVIFLATMIFSLSATSSRRVNLRDLLSGSSSSGGLQLHARYLGDLLAIELSSEATVSDLLDAIRGVVGDRIKEHDNLKFQIGESVFLEAAVRTSDHPMLVADAGISNEAVIDVSVQQCPEAMERMIKERFPEEPDHSNGQQLYDEFFRYSRLDIQTQIAIVRCLCSFGWDLNKSPAGESSLLSYSLVWLSLDDEGAELVIKAIIDCETVDINQDIIPPAPGGLRSMAFRVLNDVVEDPKFATIWQFMVESGKLDCEKEYEGMSLAEHAKQKGVNCK